MSKLCTVLQFPCSILPFRQLSEPLLATLMEWGDWLEAHQARGDPVLTDAEFDEASDLLATNENWIREEE